jgi:hypothetical protein
MPTYTGKQKTAIHGFTYCPLNILVAANRHPGQVGYSHSPPQEVRNQESSLRADPGMEGEGHRPDSLAHSHPSHFLVCSNNLPGF